jgi:hypothetical protein
MPNLVLDVLELYSYSGRTITIWMSETHLLVQVVSICKKPVMVMMMMMKMENENASETTNQQSVGLLTSRYLCDHFRILAPQRF